MHANIDLHPTVESKAPEVEFVELSEDPQETEEVIDLILVVEGVFEDTNLAGTKGKPRCIYNYPFYNRYKIIKFGLFHDCALLLGVDCKPILLCIIRPCLIGQLCHLLKFNL